MAPYAVAHFKIGLELSGRHLPELQRDIWAYHFQGDERLNIFLTNTLEGIEHVTHQAGPLAALTKEANEASAVKRHRPVLVVLGNPPYANFGRQNRNDFILGLLDDYKRGLKEKKINLNDDFIKFLRWAQWRIEQTGQGVIGFITNNVYLDGLTHRRMRESLLETFDEIYILNLHGSAKKQETVADGSKDDNVFDITVGVAIAMFVKLPARMASRPIKRDRARRRRKKQTRATIHHADLWGLRKNKYDWLNVHNAANTEWTTFQPDAPDFRFVPRNAKHEKEWNEGWSIHDIFPVSNNGLKTDRDELFFDFDQKELEKRMMTFFSKRTAVFVSSSNTAWKIPAATTLKRGGASANFRKKPSSAAFIGHLIFAGFITMSGLTSRPAEKVMRHFLAGENLALACTARNPDAVKIGAFFVALMDSVTNTVVSLYDIDTVFPLYLYPNGESEEQAELVPHENGRRPNLSAEFVKQFAETCRLEIHCRWTRRFEKDFRAGRYFSLRLRHFPFAKLS